MLMEQSWAIECHRGNELAGTLEGSPEEVMFELILGELEGLRGVKVETEPCRKKGGAKTLGGSQPPFNN